MKEFLSSTIAILILWLATFSMMADNYSPDASEAQTYILPGKAFKFLPQEGFCLYDWHGIGSLTSTDQFVMDMTDLMIKYDIAYKLPELQETSSYVYKIVDPYCNGFEKKVESATYPVVRLKYDLMTLFNQTKEAEDKLNSIAAASNKSAKSIAVNQVVRSNGIVFDFSESGAVAEKITEAYYWYDDDIESKIEYALSVENDVLKDISDWSEGIVNKYQPFIDDYNSRLSAINDRIKPEMSDDEILEIANSCRDLMENIDWTSNNLKEETSNIMYRNPWDNIYYYAQYYYGFLKNQEPLNFEEIDKLLADAMDTAESTELPKVAFEYACENGDILKIPAEVEINGETISITRIKGTIIPTMEETRADDISITVTVPKTVDFFEGNCFYNPHVKSVIMENPVPPYQGGVQFNEWENIIRIEKDYCPFMLKEDSHAVLYVPDEAVERYKESLWTYYFDEILPISDSAVDDITINPDDENSTEIYNLNGIKIGKSTDGLGKGIYIVKKGGKTSKVMIP